jgi:hypothetical protein
MANVLTNIMPKILAAGLSTLRERAIMPRLVNSSYSSEAAQKGTTIDVPVPTAITTINVTPSNVLVAPTDDTPGLVQVPLDQWKQNEPFGLTDRELTEIDRNRHYVPMQVSEAVKSLANTLNQHIHAQYTGVYGYFANATSIFNDVTDATQARKILNTQLCPRGDRRMVLDFEAEANALELGDFNQANLTADQGAVKIEGEVGRKFGFDIFADDHVVTHTPGTLSGTTGSLQALINDASVTVGQESIDLDDTSLTGTIVVGDIFTVTGDTQTYVCDATVTAATNAITGMTFSPPAKVAWADDAVLTVKGSHTVNMAFHRDAFAFAQRPLLTNTVDLALGSEIMSMQDPVTGVVLRLEVSRQHKQVVWEFDVLYGAKLVRPELACRIAG